MIVAPSFLTADMHRLEAEIASVRSAEWLHFDVMDGQFVPAVTYDQRLVETVRGYSDRYFDCHLMTEKPEASFAVYAGAGADAITFHLEASQDPAAGIALLHALGLKAGLAIKPATPVERLAPFLADVYLVLVMSVEPGKGGQKFMVEALDRIAWLVSFRAERGLGYLIEVDGGINGTTAPLVRRAGADVVVAGSFIFNRNDREAAIAELVHGRPD
ncbi:MAG: ribulose-phosphate 3-epimerase [Tenericutes bacterium GWF2_57_13]|nr:MAG: ribulose-phosphate 3-epimerase [Tenericutes bacterium GWF2_57_13]